MDMPEVNIEHFQKWKLSKAIIIETDMSEQVQMEAKECVTTGIDKASGSKGLNIEKACKFIKELMDRQFGTYWHCIIGEGFSFEIERQAKATLYMYYAGKFAILLYKC
ncbi:unnamed protein product [Moneuplotes crassus]|uniref:Dynein light chain n=1 Tax=Euplotes crassus TaxID=5936 RepID=A0AAD2DA39_EUPCR|nr:unnamed protein product [Moneuplotes crassus]